MRGARSPRARICGQGQGIGMVTEEIQTYKQREDALILAHYYVPDEVQALADYVGDSYYLAKAAAKAQKRTVVFCGVRFMGESAKILNPASRVLLPAADADCPMAHMEKAAHIASLRANIRDLAVVCYINSDAKLKALSDVCVTSSNAVKIVSALPNRNILFIPDENLGSFVRAQVPHKNFFFSGGKGNICRPLPRARRCFPAGYSGGAPRASQSRGAHASRMRCGGACPRRLRGQHGADHRRRARKFF